MAPPHSADWSNKVETLVNEGKEADAEGLLKSVINDEETKGGESLALAAALNDLGLVYCKQGLSSKADPLLQRALLIRTQMEAQTSERDNEVLHQLDNLEIDDIKVRQKPIGAEPSLSEEESADWEERDWDDETAVPPIARQIQKNAHGVDLDDFDRPIKTQPIKSQPSVSSGSKPRGRGAVRFGGGSLYSDLASEELEGQESPTSGELEERENIRRVSLADESDSWRRAENDDTTRADESTPERSGRADDSDDWAADRTPLVNAGEMEHVIEVYGFAPTVKTMDLETLFWAYREEGVAIKWVDDTHAVAVFRTPSAARTALTSVKDSKYKLRPFSEASLSAQRLPPEDLRPPLPRPKTTARAARRLIANALDDVHVKKAVRALSNPSDERRLEAERRSKRNLTHQLKADAWGDGYS